MILSTNLLKSLPLGLCFLIRLTLMTSFKIIPPPVRQSLSPLPCFIFHQSPRYRLLIYNFSVSMLIPCKRGISSFLFIGVFSEQCFWHIVGFQELFAEWFPDPPPQKKVSNSLQGHYRAGCPTDCDSLISIQ